jgi:hypothetical protein
VGVFRALHHGRMIGLHCAHVKTIA